MLLYSVTGKRVKGIFMFFIFRYSCLNTQLVYTVTLIIQDEGEEEEKKWSVRLTLRFGITG